MLPKPEFLQAIEEEGGPAFPGSFDVGDEIFSHSGMTLRDWFAGMFLSGAVGGEDRRLDVPNGASKAEIDEALRTYWAAVARSSYIAADAMLAARASLSSLEEK